MVCSNALPVWVRGDLAIELAQGRATPPGYLLAILMELYLFGHPFQEHVVVAATSLLNKGGSGGAQIKLLQADLQRGVFDDTIIRHNLKLVHYKDDDLL